MSSKHQLLSCVFLPGLLLMPLAFAGDIAIQKFDPSTGGLSPWVKGSTAHAPSRLLERGSPYLLDSCGQVYSFAEGTFGEMSLDGPLTPLYSLRDMQHMEVNDFSGVAINRDGRLLKLILDIDLRDRMGERHFDWIEDPGSAITAGDTATLVHSRAGPGTYLFKTNGDLLKIDGFGEGQDSGRYLGERAGWKDVTHAIAADILAGRNDLQSMLITVHTDGSIKRHIINRDGDDYVLDSAVVEGTYEGTRALLPNPGHNHSYVLRLTESGDLYRLDVLKGSEERLGEAGAFENGIVHIGESEGYFVTSSGSFTEACPKEPVAEVVVDPNADFDIETAIREAEALAKGARTLETAVYERVELTPPDDLMGKSEAGIDAAMNVFMTELTAFEDGQVQPVVNQADAFSSKYASYGNFDELRDLMLEKSENDFMLEDSAARVARSVESFKEYKASLGNHLLGDARIRFQMAELQSDAKEMARMYLEAIPLAKWAVKLDPDNEEARGYLEKAAGLAGNAISSEKTAIANASWPDDDEYCECDLDEFKERALYYFRSTQDHDGYKTGRRIVAVRIRGAMSPGETNVLGEVLNWHVPVWIAETDPAEPWFLTVLPIVFDTETNDRNSGFSTYHFDGDEYQIPIERVEIDDPEMLETSLEIIETTTGQTPDDMPDDAMDASVTGVAPRAGVNEPDDPDHGDPGNVINEEPSDPIDPNAGGIDTTTGSTASVSENAGSAAGRIAGWLLALSLLGGCIWAARKWSGKVKERLSQHVSTDGLSDYQEKLKSAQNVLKEKSMKAAEKAREVGGTAAERARRKAEDLRRK